MTIRSRVAIATLLAFDAAAFAAFPDAALAADEPGAPHTIKVAAAESVEEGEAGERRSTFMLVHSDQGTCYAVAPPGGEGMVAGDSYVVVQASGVDDALKQKLTSDHPGCAIVDVVARAKR